MVARSPPKQRRLVAPLNPVLLRETLRKVEKCMERLQELQYTVAGGRKVISGVSLSPRSTRGYLRTSLRCKQETLRLKTSGSRRSPVGKFPASSGGDWRRMSLPAMLLGETVGEILEATQFARDIVAAVSNNNNPKKPTDDPKTPLTQQRKQRPSPENTELRTRRKREKKQLPRTEQASPPLQLARSRINFKVSPPKNRETEKENCRYMANRVSPRNRPWVKKTVLFPNPVFLNSSPPNQQKFCRTGSPMDGRKIRTPLHEFLIKSPPSTSKFQVKIKSPPIVLQSIPSPTRQANLSNKSLKLSTASNLRRSFSPSRLANKLVSPLKSRNKVQTTGVDVVPSGLNSSPPKQQKICRTGTPMAGRKMQTPPHKFLIKSPPSTSKFQVKIKSPPIVLQSIPSPTRQVNLSNKPLKLSTASKLRRSFSPSKLANKLVSPLKSRKKVQTTGVDVVPSGLKQHPVLVPRRFSTGRM